MREERRRKRATMVRFNTCSPPQARAPGLAEAEPAAPAWCDDPELEALEQDLRAAGERLSRVGVVDGAGEWIGPGILDPFGCVLALVLGAGYYLLIFLPARLTYAAIQRARFRRRLRGLPPEQRPAALELLKGEMAGDAGPIARGLIRHLERPSELVAAPGRPGSGDEVSPAA